MKVKFTGNSGYVLYRVCKKGYSIIGIFRYKNDCIAFQRYLSSGRTYCCKISDFDANYHQLDDLRLI